MSAGYASRLKEYPHKGVCGLPERKETQRSLKLKLQQLGQLVRESSHLVVLTGAGISTSAGIPDFRGPNGVWTVEHNNTNKKRKREPVTMDFANAQPTYTHRALTKLASENIVKYVVTQNVDGLHKRSGLSRSKHAVLHGCAFTEKCESCHAEHFRDFDIGGMSFQKTGRHCTLCKTGALRDTLLDWEDPLPEDDFERATMECAKAELVLCLGTSLRIEPAGSLPKKAKRFVIVNLQETPYDEDAALVIRNKVDDTMKSLMSYLGFEDEDWDKNSSVSAPMIERVWRPDKTNVTESETDGTCHEKEESRPDEDESETDEEEFQ